MTRYRRADDCRELEACLDNGLRGLGYDSVVLAEANGWECIMTIALGNDGNPCLMISAPQHGPSNVYHPYTGREPVFDGNHYIGFQFGDAVQHVQLVDVSESSDVMTWPNIEVDKFRSGYVRALILVPR